MAASELLIDLGAIRRNYQALRQRLNLNPNPDLPGRQGGTECAAAVKADAYGTGVAETGPALFRAGCRTFFVATPEEGIALRGHLPAEARIAVLNGLLPGTGEAFTGHGLIPVINDLEQLSLLRRMCVQHGAALPAMLHIDTGMNRLGLSPDEMDRIAATPELLDGPDWVSALSHLASADCPENPENAAQRARFIEQHRRLQRDMPRSLANSAGIFLGPEYHFQLARPGFALYGGRVQEGQPGPMEPVVRLRARILQVRTVRPGGTVGYGGTYRMAGGGRVAIVAAGYADGYMRHLSGRGRAFAGNRDFPLAGRISMDMLAIDISAAEENAIRPGDFMELLGPRYTVNDAADDAGTIGYEILTGLGHRYTRRYIDTGNGET